MKYLKEVRQVKFGSGDAFLVIMRDQLDVLKYILSEGVQINLEMLKLAYSYGHLDITEYLNARYKSEKGV